MSSEMTLNSAAASARVFQVEPTVSYKPSVWYFRKSLRESESRQKAVTVSLVVCCELEQLRVWAGDKGATPRAEGVTAAIECMRHALRASKSHDQVIMLGLYLCHELEQLKAVVREFGLIPPKWIVDPQEAEEKGWATKPAGQEGR